MSIRPIRLASLVLLAAGAVARPALAQPGGGSGAAVLEGRFTSAADGSAQVQAAIEQVVRKMNFALRPFARTRLRSTNDAPEFIVIERRADSILVSLGPGAPIGAPCSGEPVAWTRPGGERVQVRAACEDVRLAQTFVASDGRRDNVFTLEADGGLTMSVTVTSTRLPEPLTYRLRYRRSTMERSSEVRLGPRR